MSETKAECILGACACASVNAAVNPPPIRYCQNQMTLEEYNKKDATYAAVQELMASPGKRDNSFRWRCILFPQACFLVDSVFLVSAPFLRGSSCFLLVLLNSYSLETHILFVFLLFLFYLYSLKAHMLVPCSRSKFSLFPDGLRLNTSLVPRRMPSSYSCGLHLLLLLCCLFARLFISKFGFEPCACSSSYDVSGASAYLQLLPLLCVVGSSSFGTIFLFWFIFFFPCLRGLSAKAISQ